MLSPRCLGPTIEELKTESRSRDVAFPRQIAMYLTKLMTDASLSEIGRQLGAKHHTKVRHSTAKIHHLRATDDRNPEDMKEKQITGRRAHDDVRKPQFGSHTVHDGKNVERHRINRPTLIDRVWVQETVHRSGVLFQGCACLQWPSDPHRPRGAGQHPHTSLISRKIPECLQHLSISVWVQPHSGLREKSFLLSLKVDRKALGFEVASQALAGDFSTPVVMMNSEVESQQSIPVGLIAAAEQFGTESVRKTRSIRSDHSLCKLAFGPGDRRGRTHPHGHGQLPLGFDAGCGEAQTDDGPLFDDAIREHWRKSLRSSYFGLARLGPRSS